MISLINLFLISCGQRANSQDSAYWKFATAFTQLPCICAYGTLFEVSSILPYLQEKSSLSRTIRALTIITRVAMMLTEGLVLV